MFFSVLFILILIIPFIALMLEATGRRNGVLTQACVFSMIVSLAIAFLFGGFHQRPRVASIFTIAFFAWPIALLIAKTINCNLSWVRLYLTVPIMSWYIVNTSIQFYYPSNSPGFGAAMGIVVGWSYMIFPFGFLWVLLMLVEGIVRLIKKLFKH